MYPVLFRVFGLPVHSYGLMLAIAFGVGALILRRLARQARISDDCVVDLVLWACLGAIIGARLLFVLLEWEYYSQYPEQLISVSGGGLSGLSFHGGVIGGVVAGLLVVRRYGVNPWHMADLVAPLLALGTGIARFGCLLNGCCYGYVSRVPWAFPCAAVDSSPRHPTQLYAVVGNLLIFAWLWRRRGKLEYRGENALGYVIAYAVMRSVVEVWRDSQILFAPFKTTQVANAVIILLALIVNWRLAQNRQRQGEGWAGE